MRYKFIATGYKGLEDIHVKECKEIGIKVISQNEGKVVCGGSITDIIKANLLLKTVNKIHLVIKEAEFDSLEDIYRIARNIDYSNIFDENLTFAVKTSRVGDHNFTSLDVNRTVGKAIIDSFLDSTGKRLKVRLKNPDVQIRVYVIDKVVRIAINTSGDSLHKRGYRKIKHIAPLKPTLAASLAVLADLHSDSLVLDPFCGTGTILIESAFRIRKIYPNINRDIPVFRLDLFSNVNIDKIRKDFSKKVSTSDLIFGSDIDKDYVRGAKKSVNYLNLDRIYLAIRDATKIKYNLDITHLISNPPYGIKMWNHSVKKIAIKFLNELKGTGYKKVLISPNKKWREIISRNFEVEEQRKVLYGKFTNFISIFY